MSGGFGAGFLKGTIFSVVAAGVVSLAVPLPKGDPAGKTQIDLSTPAGSGFNTGRADTDPVLPNTDQTLKPALKEAARKPELDVTTGTLPSTSTEPLEQPSAQTGNDLPKVESGENDVAMVSPVEDESPVITPPALGVPMPEISNPVADTTPAAAPTIKTPAATVDPAPVIKDASGGGTQPNPQVQTQITEQDGSALMRNKVVFENPEGKPLMAVILIDAGAEGLDREVLGTFTFPVTFAIDPTNADAKLTAVSLKKAGFEILAMTPSGETGLVEAENAADFQAILGGIFSKIPGAIGLIDQPSAKVQNDAALAGQVIAALKASGHGLVTYDQGLNSTDKKAIRADLKSGLVFRIMDNEHEKGLVIKRYLDRAVLEAGKDGRVIVVAHSYPETVTALFSWALSAKSATIAFAPVSAVLLGR